MRFLYLILALLSIVAFVEGGVPPPKPPKNVCNQKKDPGNALASIPRFYFNSKTRKCLEFIYGGAGGNGNNFETLRECNKECVCGLPPKKGKGMADEERWYFNQNENACKSFVYKGKNGNANNFVSASDCLTACGEGHGVEEPSPWGKKSTEKPKKGKKSKGGKRSTTRKPSKGKKPSTGEEDVCTLPMKKGKGKGNHTRWYYNGEVCMEFNFKGKKGNANNFMSKKDCLNACEKDVCKQLMDKGPGRAIFYRYYYNQEKKKCLKFSFGGQGGNGNNFMSKKECNKACLKGKKNKGKKPKGEKPPTEEEDVCKLPMESGPAQGSFPRFYYNKRNQKCEQFVYGGEGGNSNNFETFKACNKKCVCGQKKHPGKHQALFERYYYNKMEKKCLKFNFGGGKGNANNFMTKEECGEACLNSENENVCKLPMEVGDGKAREPMYYFNQKKQKCSKFYYGGQGGNGNKFQSMEACNYECVCSQPKQKGKGKANHRRWYFNGMKCMRFNFGGGKRNANHFKNEEACKKACMKPQ